MTFRDDHDAALNRADALEDEVERKEAELAKTKKRLETNDEELAKLREENARLKKLPLPPREKPKFEHDVDDVVPHPRPAPIPYDRNPQDPPRESQVNQSNVLAIFVLLVILGGLGISAWILLKGKPHAAEKSRVQPGSGR
jgi:hypothetical protein